MGWLDFPKVVSAVAEMEDKGVVSLVDTLEVLKKGEIVEEGSPDEVMTQTLLNDVFDLKANVFRDPVSNTPMCVAI